MSWGAAIGAAINFVGGERANKANANQARYNRDFQERMARNSYQYATEDLKKAGLNPVLAALSGGAATPSGATAAPMQNSAKAGLEGYNQSRLAKQAVKTGEADEKLKGQQENTSKAQAIQAEETSKNLAAQRAIYGAQAISAEAKARLDVQDVAFWQQNPELRNLQQMGLSGGTLAGTAIGAGAGMYKGLNQLWKKFKGRGASTAKDVKRGRPPRDKPLTAADKQQLAEITKRSKARTKRVQQRRNQRKRK